MVMKLTYVLTFHYQPGGLSCLALTQTNEKNQVLLKKDMTEEQIYTFLKKIFTNNLLAKEITAHSLFQNIEAKQSILKEGYYVKVVPLVITGRIKVIRRDDSGKELLLYYIEPGESCALSIAAGLNHNKSVVYAETEQETAMLAIPVSKMEAWIPNHPQFNAFISSTFQQRFNELVQFIDSVAFKTIDFRLVELLKKKQSEGGTQNIDITHQELANELGTAREVVSRLLKKLENEEKLVNHRGHIEIVGLL